MLGNYENAKYLLFQIKDNLLSQIQKIKHSFEKSSIFKILSKFLKLMNEQTLYEQFLDF